MVRGGKETECRSQRFLFFIQESLLCGNSVTEMHVKVLK